MSGKVEYLEDMMTRVRDECDSQVRKCVLPMRVEHFKVSVNK
jgi:hypothetical protein